MTFEEAHNKLLKEYKNRIAKKSCEYSDHYIFLLADKKNSEIPVKDSFFAVDKKTGDISAYQPMNDKNHTEFFKIWEKAK